MHGSGLSKRKVARSWCFAAERHPIAWPGGLWCLLDIGPQVNANTPFDQSTPARQSPSMKTWPTLQWLQRPLLTGVQHVEFNRHP
jgi:hypothetical protein